MGQRKKLGTWGFAQSLFRQGALLFADISKLFEANKPVLRGKHVPTFYIKKANADDLLEISELEMRSAEYEHRLAPLSCGLNDLYDIWYQRLLSGEYEILIAEVRPQNQSRQVVGFIGFVAPQYKHGFVQAMYVDPRYFRMRVGLNLFNAAEKIMIARSCPYVTLHVEPCNVGGQKFYSKLGFINQNYKYRHLLVLAKRLAINQVRKAAYC